MKFSDFNEQMQRLVKVYGAPKYPDERISMIFESIGSIDSDTMKRQISFFIGSMDKAPMLNDFTQALGSVLVDARKREIESKMKLLEACLICNDTGHVTMFQKDSGFEFAFQCECPRGALLQPSFPKQYYEMRNFYASHRAWAAGRFDRVNALSTYKHKMNA